MGFCSRVVCKASENMGCKMVAASLLFLGFVVSFATGHNYITEIDIFTSDCSDCGMPSFLGQLSVKVCGKGQPPICAALLHGFTMAAPTGSKEEWIVFLERIWVSVTI